MLNMLLQVLVDDQPMECATFGLHELQAAHRWVQCKIAFYSPVVVDLMVTIVAPDGYECVEFIPELSKVYPTIGCC